MGETPPVSVLVANLAGAAEYTEKISAEGKNFPNKFPEYDTKKSDGKVPVLLELWGMWSTPSGPLLPGPLYKLYRQDMT